MAKRKTTGKGSGGARQTPAQLRSQIDRLDREILTAINQRAALSHRLGETLSEQQAEQAEPRLDAIGDDQVLANVREHHKGPLAEVAVLGVFRELLSGVRALRRPVRTAYLGPQYSYSHLAAVKRFGQSTELVPVATIRAVFEEINRRQAHFGLVPIANSTDGRIADTLNMFMRVSVKICGEVQLRIHHNLLGKCDRADVREVYSKPQAISQCRDWLAKHLPAARAIEMTSTTAAAQLAADKPGVAAIASRQAATNYGLDILAENIEDDPDNITRFAVIGNESCRRTGKDKTSLMLQIEHQPGALADVMAIFKRGRLNLSWIESFPIPGSASEFLFFVELDGHATDAKVQRAIASLERRTVRLEILGSYPRSEPIE